MLFSKQSKEIKRLSSLVKEICREQGIEESIVLYFINNDIERVLNLNRIDAIKLNQLENEINKTSLEEVEIKLTIKEKEALLRETSANISSLSITIKEKEELLSKQQQVLTLLQTKLNEIKSKIVDGEKNQKQIEYDFLVKNHANKLSTGKSLKRIYLILFLFTVIGMIIATILILNKKK